MNSVKKIAAYVLGFLFIGTPVPPVESSATPAPVLHKKDYANLAIIFLGTAVVIVVIWFFIMN